MRPIHRPATPYTAEQILQHVYNHFFVENQPFCYDESPNGPYCRYDRTGCAVGCLLTQEQGDALEEDKGGLKINHIKNMPPDIEHDLDLLHNTSILAELQYLHDLFSENNNKLMFKTSVVKLAERYSVKLEG